MSNSHYPQFGFDLKPQGGRLGAVITGITLDSNLDAAVFERLQQALYHYKVLFFRGQNHLDDAGQEAFTARFGGLVSHPTAPTKTGSNHVLELDSNHGGRANSWHTDVTFQVAYPKIAVLRGIVIPEGGGDTVWANTATAYQDLPEALRQTADHLWALHTNDYDYGNYRTAPSAVELEKYKVFTSTVYETEHPVVHVHPVTGERNLLLGHFVKRLIGLNSFDSQHLLAVLQNYVTRLDNTVRWKWTEGDVAIWDNQATQHYAVNDYGDQHRVVRRVTVDGVPAVGIDGKSSVSRSVVQRSDAANSSHTTLSKVA